MRNLEICAKVSTLGGQLKWLTGALALSILKYTFVLYKELQAEICRKIKELLSFRIMLQINVAD